MQITINPKLVSALEAEAIIAKRTSEEYVEMIINSHLTEKQKNRLFEKVMFIGVENVEPIVNPIAEQKQAEIDAAWEAEQQVILSEK